MPIKPENRARYPANWKEIRKRIQLRAGDYCEMCGVRNHSYIRRTGKGNNDYDYAFEGDVGAIRIVCTVMHLDHIPENCTDDNLCFACQRCHNRYDALHRADTRHRIKENP